VCASEFLQSTYRVIFEESSWFLSVITEATSLSFCFRALHIHSLRKQRCGNGLVLFVSIFGCCHSEPGQPITSDKKLFHFCSCYVLLHCYMSPPSFVFFIIFFLWFKFDYYMPVWIWSLPM
jgi:hypothetical protein